jgi:hypothetical protein
MQPERNDIDHPEKSQEVAERADQLTKGQAPKGHNGPDLTQSKLSRRGHLCQISALFAAALPLEQAALRGARPPALSTSGVELESLRPGLKRDPDQTLKSLADKGFRDAEGYGRVETLALMPKLKQYGIAVRSCLVEVPLITANWDPFPDLKPVPLPEAISGIAEAGISFFTMNAIGKGVRGDGDDFYRRTADRMNIAGEMCRKAGIRFAWRMDPADLEAGPGGRPIDIYRERLDLKLAPLELDATKVKPLPMLKAWKGHVPLLLFSEPDDDLFKTAAVSGVEYCFRVL